MKDKRTSVGISKSPQRFQNNNISNSYTTFKKQIRRTLGSDEEDDKVTWNVTANKLSPFYSPPKNRSQLQELKAVLQQNIKLKQQVKALKQMLMESNKYSKFMEMSDMVAKSKRQERSEEIQKLKKIIEKSYYSIKQMEQQIYSLNQKLSNCNRNIQVAENKNKMLQFQRNNLQTQIKNIIIIHTKQLQHYSQKINKLQTWIQHLSVLIQQDKKNWEFQKQQLKLSKKLYNSKSIFN